MSVVGILGKKIGMTRATLEEQVVPKAAPPGVNFVMFDEHAATQQALQNLYKQQQAQEHYTIPQFVSTEQTAGIPARLVGGAVLPGVPAPVPQLVPMPGAAPAPGKW